MYRLPLTALLLPLALTAQVATGLHSRILITGRMDGTRLQTLAGNTRSQANAQNDRGRVADDFPMEHMLLQLQRPEEQEQAAKQMVDDLHNPKSANFHKWLTPAQYGQLYGPAQSDVDTVTGWLKSHGFTVNAVYPSGMEIDFSGTAGQVRTAFHTEIHNLSVNGQAHVANMSDPQIPAALAPAVRGVVSLHDFTPHSMTKPHANFTFTSQGYTMQAVTPSDLATIYNLNPLFAAGVTGQGQTIAVIEDSDLYRTSDYDTFRTTLGLSAYTSGSLTTLHPAPPSGNSNCADPGVVGGNDAETTLDAEWASAAAPGASIVVASCADTRTTFGGLIALDNLVNSATPPAVVSISYGDCEVDNGEASNASFNAIYQQAVAEGISVFVAAGDEGAASCDAGASEATHGIGVSAYASTPYNVAVGGTDFGDAYAGTVATYWSSTNSATYGSALSYIPEVPWNASCAGGLLAGYLGFASVYGTNGFCGSSAAKEDQLLEVAAGSGGPSGCATGRATTSLVVSGTCQGYAKPSWQAGVTGLPADGVRDLPDVSLFASNGVWGHYYVMCFSDVRNGGASCSGDPSNWAGGGGTSYASPIMAGIQALVNQNAGGPQGNPNYVYYQLAATQYSGGYLSSCNSTNGNATDPGCIFYNVTQGDIAVNCGGAVNCYGYAAASSGPGFGGRRGGGGQQVGNGALSTSTDSYSPAFGTPAGWNFSTGIGSINAANLVNNWITGQ
ncbi:MAG: protease pro-enzyme activation domain-containing protein [Bryobacteraceae bacterium]